MFVGKLDVMWLILFEKRVVQQFSLVIYLIVNVLEGITNSIPVPRDNN